MRSAVLAPDSPGQVCPRVTSPRAEPGGGQLCPQQWGYVTQLINSVAVLKHDTDNENSLNKLHRGHKFPLCNLWLYLHHQTIQLPNLLSLFQYTKSAPVLYGYYASHPTHVPGSCAMLEASSFLASVHSLVRNPSNHNCPCQKAGKNPGKL